MKILLVEDDAKLGKNTKELLEFENCSVDWAQDGREAMECFKQAQASVYDVVVLDWMLPELSGMDLCRLLRRKHGFQGGIIFVTAKGELEDCIRALNEGADDYMVKPFRVKELTARLRALCRRKGKPFVDKVYEQNSIKINHDLNLVTYQNQDFALRKKEFALFELLFINMNNILPRETIFEKIWDDKLNTNMESLDSHIYTLRKKIRDFALPLKITLVKNIGYKMELEK